MEYINIINDNSNVIINDDFRNLSIIEVQDTPWKRAFNMERLNLDYPNESYNPQHYQISKNYNELVFVAPNGSNAFNKAFCQTNTPSTSIVFTPTELIESFIYNPIKWGYGWRGNPGPFNVIYDVKDKHSFKVLKFGERFPSGRYGVEVYNENGAMIFTSNNRYLKIKDFIFIPNFFRPYFNANRHGYTIENVNALDRNTIRWERYRDDPGYNGIHCHFKRYTYDEPIAICAFSLPAPVISLGKGGKNCFSYLSFENENTFNLWGELGSVYVDTSEDSNIENYTEYSTEDRGNSDILALMVIARNDYL